MKKQKTDLQALVGRRAVIGTDNGPLAGTVCGVAEKGGVILLQLDDLFDGGQVLRKKPKSLSFVEDQP